MGGEETGFRVACMVCDAPIDMEKGDELCVLPLSKTDFESEEVHDALVEALEHVVELRRNRLRMVNTEEFVCHGKCWPFPDQPENWNR